MSEFADLVEFRERRCIQLDGIKIARVCKNFIGETVVW